MIRRAAFAAAALTLAAAAHADPPPKVCVAVVGDHDESVRALADDVTARISSGNTLRGVADADSRAALRGEPAVTANELTAARRALRGTDADIAALRTLGDQLGCAWFVELAARPAGTLVRVVNVLSGAAPDTQTHARIDAAAVVDLVQRMIASAASPGAAAPDAGPLTDPLDGAVSADASAPGDAPGDAATSGDVGSLARAAASVSPRGSERPLISRIWPWLLVGGLAFVGAAVAILVAPAPETSTRLTIVHPGSQ